MTTPTKTFAVAAIAVEYDGESHLYLKVVEASDENEARQRAEALIRQEPNMVDNRVFSPLIEVVCTQVNGKRRK